MYLSSPSRDSCYSPDACFKLTSSDFDYQKLQAYHKRVEEAFTRGLAKSIPHRATPMLGTHLTN